MKLVKHLFKIREGSFEGACGPGIWRKCC